MTTERTARSEYQYRLIAEFASDCTVVTVGTNQLVPMIEVGKRGEIEEVVHEVLVPFREKNIDVLVLGCTHYPLIKDIISREVGKGVTIFDSGEAIAAQVRKLLKEKNQLADRRTEEDLFYTTGDINEANNILQNLIEELKREKRRRVL